MLEAEHRQPPVCLWPPYFAASLDPGMRQCIQETSGDPVNAIHDATGCLVQQKPHLGATLPNLNRPARPNHLITVHDGVGAAAIGAQPLTIVGGKVELWLLLPWLQIYRQEVGGGEGLCRRHALVFISG
jgi:hypothetical protein